MAFHSALSDLFATSQVDEAQLGAVLLVVTAMHPIHKQNGVTPRRTVIIVRACDLPILISEPDQIHDFQMILHLHLHQPFEDHRVIELLQPHSLGRLLQRIEQVDQLLVVNLEDGACYLI